jgi:dephospho-CoA kinase
MSVVLGLTGSLAMGKSATLAMIRRRGVPVHDADRAVHDLYRTEAVAPVGGAFPEALLDGRIDRERLGRVVFGDAAAMARLEAIVHPLVQATERAFLARQAAHRLVVLDIPLLFETGAERRCDAVIVVSAPAAVQRERALARPGMSEQRFAEILARQMQDDEKRRRAHWVIDTGRGFDAAQAQVDDLLRALAGLPS